MERLLVAEQDSFVLLLLRGIERVTIVVVESCLEGLFDTFAFFVSKVLAGLDEHGQYEQID